MPVTSPMATVLTFGMASELVGLNVGDVYDGERKKVIMTWWRRSYFWDMPTPVQPESISVFLIRKRFSSCFYTQTVKSCKNKTTIETCQRSSNRLARLIDDIEFTSTVYTKW